VVGTVSLGGNGTITNLRMGISPVPDPLAGVPTPSLTRPPTVPSVSVSGGSKTISPGVYQNISVTNQGSLTMNPGTYVILGQFSSTGQGQVTGSGVSLYLACASYPAPCSPGTKGAGISLTGNGAFHLTGPTSGCLPMTIFADPKNVATISLTGNAGDSLGGIIYAPSGSTTLTGNGSTFVLSGPVITGTGQVSGNGNVTLTPPGLIACSLTLAPAAAGPNAVGTSQQLSATVTGPGGSPIPGQKVTFTVTGANPNTGSATTDTTGTARFSYRGTTAGTDSVTASFTEGGTTLQSNIATISWVKSTPQISTSVSASAITVGGSVTDTATVSGGLSPGGSVSWNVYAASDTNCQSPLNPSPLTAALSGATATSPAYTPATTGTYQFVATYSGDQNNQSVSTKCGDTSEQVKTVSTYAGSRLKLTPPSSLAVTGSPQTITATLIDPQGNPLANQQLAYTVNGANSTSGNLITDSHGEAAITYTGSNAGTDIVKVTFNDPTLPVSARASIVWSNPSAPVTMTPADGQFFAEDPSQTTFVAKPGDTAAFAQNFPAIDFNPPAGIVSHDTSGVTPATRPFTDLITDSAGNYKGTIVAAGGGVQAGKGTLNSFDAYFTSNLVIANPGDVTFQVIADDGFLMGVGGGATRVSGTYQNAPSSGLSPFEAYPLAGAYDQQGSGTPQTYAFTVHFPSAGDYPFELDYFSCCGPDLSLALVLPGTSSIQPNGAGTVYVTERGGPPLTIAKVTVDQNGQATVDKGFGSSAIGNPDSMVFDNQGRLLASTPELARITMVDPSTGAVLNPQINTTPIPAVADMAVDPNSDTIYAIGYNANVIDAVDESTGAVTPLNPDDIHGEGGIAITPDGSRLFVSTHQGVIYEIDPKTGHILRSVSGVPQADGMTIDPVTGHLFVADCASDTLTCQGLRELDIGTAADPQLSVIGQFPNALGDGIAADGHGHVFIASQGCCLSSFDVSTHVDTLIANEIPSADDPAPVAGPGAPLIHIPLPPAVTLTLSPSAVSGDIVGQSQELTVSATDASGQPVSGLPVTVNIRGANQSQVSGTTDAQGHAMLAYAATSGGTDTVQATAKISGLFTISNLITVSWLAPGAPAPSGSQPPSITNVTPPSGTVISTPTPVTATVTPVPGDIIASYSVTLQSTTGGTQQTIGAGTGAPPATLATLDPAQFSAGTYTLAINATTTGGGNVTSEVDLNLQPQPPPVPPTTTGSQPPAIADITPSNGSVIGTPTKLTATITPAAGDAIASYSATLQLVSGGATTTIATGSGAPPGTLATVDPTALPDGVYALTISADAASGSSVSQIIYVTIVTSSYTPAPTMTAQASQSSYQPGQQITINATIKNTTANTCSVSTAPGSLQISSVTRDGVPQQPTNSAIDEISVGPGNPGPYQGTSLTPGTSVDLSLPSEVSTTAGSSTNQLISLDDQGNETDWDVSQPGNYVIQVTAMPAAWIRPPDPACQGAVPPITVAFTTTSAPAFTPGHITAPSTDTAASNPPTSSHAVRAASTDFAGITVMPDVQSNFGVCAARFSRLLGDPAGSWSTVQEYEAQLGHTVLIGSLADYKQLHQISNALDNIPIFGSKFAGITRFNRLQGATDTEIFYDSANRVFPSDNVVNPNDLTLWPCSVLYHELTHLANLINYGFPGLDFPCYDALDGHDTTVPVEEASATFAENAFDANSGQQPGWAAYNGNILPYFGCENDQDFAEPLPGDLTDYLVLPGS
jgi:sugar lactone lactonase YvrE